MILARKLMPAGIVALLLLTCASAQRTRFVDCPYEPSPEPVEGVDSKLVTSSPSTTAPDRTSTSQADVDDIDLTSTATSSDASAVDPPTSTLNPASTAAEAATPAGTVGNIDFTPSSLDSSTPRKPSWKDHPVYQQSPDTIVPPIVSYYITRYSTDSTIVTGRGLYTRQASGFTMIGDDYTTPEERNQFHFHDILQFAGTQGRPVENLIEFETTRDSQMCLLMDVTRVGTVRGVNGKMDPPPGYRGYGRAAWDTSVTPLPQNKKYADYTDTTLDYVYIACRKLPAGIHRLSSADLLNAQYPVKNYHLMFSESDGSIPPMTEMPPGWSGPDIKQHEKCPDQLHEMWSVDSHDSNDPDVAGKKWLTWHPQKDYLYGCYYGHEHGTPGMLMGYTERFHYTAWKNSRQDESHSGFKSYVFEHGDKNVFLNIHADTKDLDRVFTQHHTVVLAINEKSGKNVYEMSCKADFGGSFATLVRPLPSTHGMSVLPLGDQANKDLVFEYLFNTTNGYVPRPRRRLNVFNLNNLDPKFLYKRNNDGSIEGRGQYEVWTGGATGGAFCISIDVPSDGLQVDIKNAETGCKFADCKEPVNLGTDRGGGHYEPNLGTNRALVFRKVNISPSNCPYDLPPPNEDGYIQFYTNPYCTELCDGPGPNCVLQKMHSSFSGTEINNVYNVADIHGLNMYKKLYKEPWNMVMSEGDSQPGIFQVENALTLDMS